MTKKEIRALGLALALPLLAMRSDRHARDYVETILDAVCEALAEGNEDFDPDRFKAFVRDWQDEFESNARVRLKGKPK